jgi:predicted nucleotidyltransferase
MIHIIKKVYLIMVEKTREEILSLLSEIKSELENRFKVRRLALFGSYARGDQRSDSDVDILMVEISVVSI